MTSIIMTIVYASALKYNHSHPHSLQHPEIFNASAPHHETIQAPITSRNETQALTKPNQKNQPIGQKKNQNQITDCYNYYSTFEMDLTSSRINYNHSKKTFITIIDVIPHLVSGSDRNEPAKHKQQKCKHNQRKHDTPSRDSPTANRQLIFSNYSTTERVSCRLQLHVPPQKVQPKTKIS